MSEKPENPPAFARAAYTSPQNAGDPFPHHEQDGMSLRDYFAAATLPTFIMRSRYCVTDLNEIDRLVGFAYYAADAMLKARGEV